MSKFSKTTIKVEYIIFNHPDEVEDDEDYESFKQDLSGEDEPEHLLVDGVIDLLEVTNSYHTRISEHLQDCTYVSMKNGIEYFLNYPSDKFNALVEKVKNANNQIFLN